MLTLIKFWFYKFIYVLVTFATRILLVPSSRVQGLPVPRTHGTKNQELDPSRLPNSGV
jgi:hypothetical protein